MELFDTHCHLTHGRLRQDVEGVLERARQAGVTRWVCAASSVAESKAALALARRHEKIWCLAGQHPHDAKDAGPHYLKTLEELAGAAENVAVGEIGLDYHYDFSPREDQRRVFAEQLDLAARLGKRVVVHTREAFEDTLAMLAGAGVPGERLIIHCCTEPPDHVRKLLDLGAAVSFSGIVTFKKTADLREAARLVPDDRLLIETDSPFCSPEPVRKQKTNEPANVAHVARCLADVRGVALETLADQTTANALGLLIDPEQ